MLKETFLHSKHKELGAKFTEFGGWDMPVQYSSIIEEHNAVRNSVGIFDTSHMGTFIISGENAGKFLDSQLVQSGPIVRKASSRQLRLILQL